MKNTRTTFLLFCLAAAAAAFIWWFEWAPPAPSTGTSGAPGALVPFDPESICYLGIQHGGPYIACRRIGREWEMVSPVSARADSTRINKIISELERLPRGAPVTADERLARGLTFRDYGLDQPRAVVVLHDKTRRWFIRFGGESPLKNAVYVRLDSEGDVWPTSTNLPGQLPSEAADLRDRRLLRGDPELVNRLEIKRSDGPANLLSRAAGDWVFQKPMLARADEAKVTEIIRRLFALEIKRFVSETMSDPVTYGIGADEAQLQVMIWLNGNAGADTILFGKTLKDDPSLMYASVKGASSVYAVPGDMIDALGVRFTSLRGKRLYFMDEQSVRHVRIADDKRVLSLELSTNGWQITEPVKLNADDRLVSGMIAGLNRLEIERFVDGPFTNEAAADRVSGSLTLGAAPPTASAPAAPAHEAVAAQPVSTSHGSSRSLFWHRKGGAILAYFNDDPQCFEIAGGRQALFLPEPLLYRERTVLSLDPAAVRRIRIAWDGGEQVVERDSGSGPWVAIEPGRGMANEPAVDAVLGLVSNLKAVRFELSGKNDPGAFGLPGGCLSLTLGLTGAEGIQKTLVLGDLAGRSEVYAMVRGQDAVFVLELDALELLLNDLGR